MKRCITIVGDDETNEEGNSAGVIYRWSILFRHKTFFKLNYLIYKMKVFDEGFKGNIVSVGVF